MHWIGRSVPSAGLLSPGHLCLGPAFIRGRATKDPECLPLKGLDPYWAETFGVTHDRLGY